MADTPSRKLAVLLHADVVDSTALVRLDEILAHERIQDTFRRFSETITHHNGTAHEIRGDALVAEFARASDAVSASVDFQLANATHIEELGDEVRPVVRIGIAMGEVVIADNTVTGEGIVLAQRLEQLAEPGGVCIQGAAYETVPKRLPFDYEDLGECQIKGFDRPQRVYTVRGQTKPVSRPETGRGAAFVSLELPDKPSIAVLPFNNISGDPEQEYFSDGITEDIITALSKIDGLLVVARTSTMAYKGKAIDMKLVGREQGVRYVLEGSVRKGGNRIRVTAQLIDAKTGHHQWAEHYDRDLDDIFAVQDEITRKIALEMRVQLTAGEQARIRAGRIDNVEAWELVVRTSALQNSGIREDNMAAHLLAEEALEKAPNSAGVWEALGWCHANDVMEGWSETPEESLQKAFDAAQRALEIDETYHSVHALIGMLCELSGDYKRGIKAAERAVQLAPGHAENTYILGDVLTMAGRPQEGLRALTRAIRLSPVRPHHYVYSLGVCYYTMGEYESAINALEEAIRIEPDSVASRAWLTSVFVDAGKNDDARSMADEVMRIEPKFSSMKWKEVVFKDAARNERVLNNLRKAGLP